ncbi:protein kinase, partial [Streptomyces sp. NPDC052013]|uniref:protein kinase domain-containing protein n=1 Tax=Streptomyces sp. NPDC052013 TaxID=3365679 RepID=UPI0037D19EED
MNVNAMQDGILAWSAPGYSHHGPLGSGASGLVMRAHHKETGRDVAIKYLSRQFCVDERFRRGFRTEARLLAGLSCPHIAHLYEYLESAEGAAIVMELVDGISLRTLLDSET